MVEKIRLDPDLEGLDGLGNERDCGEPAAAARFVDFRYQDLIENPYREYCRALEAMGLSVGPADQLAARDWIEKSRRDAGSRHAYRPEDYGVTRAEIHEAFKFYTDRYMMA